MDSLLSWSNLMTLSGAAMITFLIVLYTSGLFDSFKWYKYLGTDVYAALWAFIILAIASIANGSNGRDWKMWLLAFFNSFLVAASAGKLRDKSISEAKKKQEKAK